MIEIKNFTKSYKKNKKIIDNLSLTVDDGCIFGFIGPNGAGKTTTIKSICGIIPFDDGDILVNGASIKNDPLKVKKQIAYVPDNPILYENMTAINYINFVCDMYEVSGDVRSKNIEKYAKMFNIEDRLNDEIASFSHGMKQKVLIVSALCHEPLVLIMDEPFVGLDPKAVFDLKEVLREFSKSGKIVFFSTHILEVAEKLCTKVAIIKQGKLVVSGNMEDVVSDESLEEVFLEIEK